MIGMRAVRGSPLIVFVNSKLGRPYEYQGDHHTADTLRERLTAYPKYVVAGSPWIDTRLHAHVGALAGSHAAAALAVVRDALLLRPALQPRLQLGRLHILRRHEVVGDHHDAGRVEDALRADHPAKDAPRTERFHD